MTNRFSMSEREFPNVHSFEAVNNTVAVVKEKKKKWEKEMVSRSEKLIECLIKLFTRWLLHYSLDSQDRFTNFSVERTSTQEHAWL